MSRRAPRRLLAAPPVEVTDMASPLHPSSSLEGSRGDPAPAPAAFVPPPQEEPAAPPASPQPKLDGNVSAKRLREQGLRIEYGHGAGFNARGYRLVKR